MRGVYDFRLVALFVAFALLAAYAALDPAGKVTATRRWAKALWRSGGAFARAFLDKVMAVRRTAVGASQKDELYFRTLAEALPEIIWTANPDGLDDFFSRKWSEYTGLTTEQSVGSGWTAAIHPDDVDPLLAKWKTALQTGEPYEVEYRFRRGSDGVYRWFLGRANPIRDAKGEIFKWFGTCTDIDDQKHNQQILADQIKERTAELAEANMRLQEEMWERDSARRELDQQNERMLREVTERSQRATMLARMGELLQSCVSKDEVFAAALGFAPKIFSLGRGAVALLNPARDLAEVIGWWAECQLPVAAFEPVSCWALRTGHPHLVVVGDTTAPCGHAEGVKNSYLCVPILAQGEALGIVHFQATDEAPTLADSELSFKTTFAGQVGLSIANIRLREALRAQSVKDPLTGLYNRRYLEETLEREIRRAVRSEQSLGILMLDLDHFKKVNDTYGHDAGDTVLREAGMFLTKSVRVEDTVCRFGGEEFVIVLPTANAEAARSRAERIRSKLRELSVRHQGQSLGRITVSIGVAELPVNGTSAADLLAAADAALYRAKREGRDQVVISEPLAATEMAAAAVSGETLKSFEAAAGSSSGPQTANKSERVARELASDSINGKAGEIRCEPRRGVLEAPVPTSTDERNAVSSSGSHAQAVREKPPQDGTRSLSAQQNQTGNTS